METAVSFAKSIYELEGRIDMIRFFVVYLFIDLVYANK